MMGPFTYWRVEFMRSSTWAQVAEVQLLSSTGVDLSVGGTASASSEYSAGYAAVNAFDKNNATEWCNGAAENTPNPGVGPWVQYQCPSPADVAKIRVRGASSTAYPLAYLVAYGSNSTSGPWTKYWMAGGRTGVVSSSEVIYDLVDPTVDGQPLPLMPATPNVCYTEHEAVGGHYVIPEALKSRDFSHGGTGMLQGYVKRDATPVDLPLVRKVLLFREDMAMVLRETWSDSTGYYRFEDLNPYYKYFVVAFDYEHNNRAAIADNLSTEAMP